MSESISIPIPSIPVAGEGGYNAAEHRVHTGIPVNGSYMCFLGNLPLELSEKDGVVKEMMAQCGAIGLWNAPAVSPSRFRYRLCEFTSKLGAAKALSSLHDLEILGHKLQFRIDSTRAGEVEAAASELSDDLVSELKSDLVKIVEKRLASKEKDKNEKANGSSSSLDAKNLLSTIAESSGSVGDRGAEEGEVLESAKKNGSAEASRRGLSVELMREIDAFREKEAKRTIEIRDDLTRSLDRMMKRARAELQKKKEKEKALEMAAHVVPEKNKKAASESIPKAKIAEESPVKMALKRDSAAPLKLASLSVAAVSRKRPRESKAGSSALFAEEPDEKKKRKIIEIDFDDEKESSSHPPVRRRAVPTESGDILSFDVNWDLIKDEFVEGTVRPWTSKQIAEYLGEEEPSMVDFVVEKVKARFQPSAIIEELSMVLDTDAQVLASDLWKIIIQEHIDREDTKAV